MILTKKKYFLSILLFTSTFTSLAQETYKAALEEYDKDNYQKAIELFTQAINKKEDIANAYKLRGACNLRLMKKEEAKKDLDMAFKLDKDAENLMYHYGVYYLAMEDYKNALVSFDKAILKDPNGDDLYGLRGHAKARLGDYVGAIKDGDRSVEMNPNEELSYTNRGYTKLLMKKYEEAIKDFDAGIKITPTQKGYVNKGYAYALMDMHSFAITYYTKSLDMVANDPITLYYRGSSYEALGKFDQACSDYIQAASIPVAANFESLMKGLNESMKRLKCSKFKD